MQPHDVLGGRRRRALDHLAHSGVLLRDLLALGVAQRVHVEQQRLLDLRVVEEIPPALRRELWMVGEHDRGAQHRVVLGGGEHRVGVQVLARLLQRGEEAPVVRTQHHVGGEQREHQRVRPPRARIGHAGVVVHRHRDQPAAVLALLHPHARPAVKRRMVELGLARPGELDPAPLGLVTLARALEEQHLGPYLALTLHHALDPQQRVAARVPVGVRRRVHDPEGRGRRVLGRPRRVGVEGVALVEEGLHELLELPAHPASVRAPESRSTIAASSVCSPRSPA